MPLQRDAPKYGRDQHPYGRGGGGGYDRRDGRHHDYAFGGGPPFKSNLPPRLQKQQQQQMQYHSGPGFRPQPVATFEPQFGSNAVIRHLRDTGKFVVPKSRNCRFYGIGSQFAESVQSAFLYLRNLGLGLSTKFFFIEM
jgi:hypothetical protein